MTTYNLTVNIEDKILKTLVAGDYSLCYAINVGGKYNVAALTVPSHVLTFANDISWTTSYSISGTQQAFLTGKVIEKPSTPSLSIVFGQEYELKSWSQKPVVNSNPDVPSNSLGLKTGQGVDAAAVIALDIPNISSTKPSPIYISPIEIPGLSLYAPIANIALWFQQNIKNSTMIELSISKSNAHIMDFTSKKSRTTKYDNNSSWTDS